MTPEQLLAWVGGIGGPVSGVVIAYISHRRSKGPKHHDTEAKVSEQEADTHQFAAVIEGFTQQVSVANANYDRLEKAHQALEAKHEALARRFTESERLRGEMLRHILALEDMVPNPPGPPPRPWGG